MSKATRRLPEALAALRLLATVAGLLPFGDNLSAGVNIAINLCEAAQAAKSNRSSYEDLSSRCTSLLLAIATCLRTTDSNKRPIVVKNMEALVQTLTEVHQAAEASVQRSETAKSRLSTRIIRPLKDMARAKKDEEEIQRLQEKITNMFTEFQLESHMRLEISTQSIADMVVDIRQEQEAQRKQIAEIQEAQAAAARDADNALLNQLDPVHAALHDSDTLEVSTCLEDTRVALLAKLDEWRASPDSPPFFWLNGLAGTGKSTIARTFCQRVASNGAAPVLLASFFISRQSADRRSAVNIVHTIAYQLALRSEGIRLAICRAMRDQADLLRRPLREQVSKLVAVPLVELQPVNPLLIVIDALDECDKDAKGREGGELIPLLCAAFYSATSSVKFLVTSRLDYTIQTTFEEVKQATSAQVVLKLHDIDHDVVRGDLRRYLVYSLRQVATRVPGLQDSLWPSDAVIESLLERAGVLFIWAATVVRFVDSHPFNPRRRLDQVLSATKNPSSSPYWKLDELYLQVLSQAVDVGDASRQDSDALVQCLRTVTGTVILLQRQLPPDALASLSGLDRLEARSMLERLSAVLVISDDEPVRALHPSFADFLADSSRCTDSRFLILEPVHHRGIAARCLSVLNGNLRRDICSMGSFEMSMRRSDPDFDERIARCIPKELGYACCYWFDHLGKSLDPTIILDELEIFACTHILHWLECMSLLAELETAVSGVSRALEWCQARLQVANATIHSVIPLLNDALSLIGEYYDPIRANPLQVYQSALLFMPCCALYMAACKDLRDSRLLSPREPAWSSDALIFQPAPNEHSEAIRCISVSPDNTLVAAVSRYALRVVVWKTSTGQVLATWVPDASKLLYILTISFSLDGKQLAIMTPVAVHWWDPHTDLRRIQTIDLKPPSRYQGQILSHSAISAGGACLAVGFSGDIDEVSLQAVDINTGEARILLRDLTVTSVAVSPDASRIASSLDDGSVPVWNARDGELLSTLNGFGLSAVALTFTLRHNIIAMTEDGAVRMRGAKSDDLVFTLGEVPVETAGRTARNFYKASLISASALSPLVAIATSKAVSIWSEDTRQLVARRQLYSDPSDGYWNTLNTAVAFMSDRPGLIVAPTQEDVYLWNFQTQQAANAPPFDLLGRAINSVRFSHDGCFVISGSDDPDLRVWKTCSGVLEATIRTGHTRSVTAVAFALRDRSLVLSGADDSQDMELREAESCGLLQHFDTSSRMQMSDQLLAFSLDGSQFATMSQDSSWNVLRLYKSDTGHVLAEEPQSESEYFSAISFLPDGSRIIAMSLSAMKSWSTLTQPPLMDPRTTSISAQRQDYFRSFACSSDSALIVSASERGEIYLWDARTGEKIQTASDFALLDLETPVPEYSNFHALQYSPTTRGRFLSCSWAGVIRIWNDDKLEIERTIMPIHLGPGRHLTPGSDVTACYSPDGERIAVAAEHITIGGNLRRYQLGVYEVNTGHAIQELAPIISYIAHEDPGSCESLNDASQMSLGFSPDGQHVFFLKAGLPRVEVWSVLNGEHIGSLWSPLRTGLAAFSICPITARLIVTCNPKSITHRVTEAAEVSVELVAQSGLAGANATAMCISIAQDLFEANQTYLCVWDTYSFQLQSTLRCGHDGFQPPHSCIAQDSRSLLRQPLPRHHTVPAVRQIPRLHRPRFDLSSNGWVVFFLNPDGVSPRRYRAEDTEDEDLLIEVCNIPGNRRPAIFSALLKSYRSPWGPVAVHRYVLAIGSLRGSVSIIDLTSLITKVERRADLEQS